MLSLNTESIWLVRACRQTAMHAEVLISLMRTDVTSMNTQTSHQCVHTRNEMERNRIPEQDSKEVMMALETHYGACLVKMSLNLVPNPWPFLDDGTESPSVTLFSSLSLPPSFTPLLLPLLFHSRCQVALPPSAVVSFSASAFSSFSSSRRSNSVRSAPRSLSGLRAPSCGRPQREREEWWRERRRIDDELGILLLSLSPRSAMESAWRRAGG